MGDRSADIVVRPPPDLPRPTPANPLARVMPVVMVVATVGMVVFYFSGTAPTGRNPMFALFPLMMLGSLLGTMAYNGRGGKRTAEINDDRRDYLRHLDTVAQQAHGIAAAQQLSSTARHPAPDALWMLMGGQRRWERRPQDPDFGCVRIGVATVGLAARFVVGDRSQTTLVDPVTTDALRAMIEANSTVADVATTVDVARGGIVSVTGDLAAARGVARAMLAQLVAFHPPELVRLVAVVDVAAQQHWDWMKWLPHHQDPTCDDACGTARLTFHDVAGLLARWPTPPGPKVVVVVDAGGVSASGAVPPDWAETLTVLDVGGVSAADAGVRLDVDARRFQLREGAAPCRAGDVDLLTVAQADALARRLAGCAVPAEIISGPLQFGARGWDALVGIGDPGSFDVDASWQDQGARHRLRVPIGVGSDGAAVELDIKEAADGGYGPHGLCVGATGSGKSELLRTLVLGLVTRHSPDVLNLVLVDFKGGATFLGLERLAHVAAVITNLADEAPLVARMRDALAGEVYRRQELLRSAGQFASVADYERARRDGARLHPLPALFIVVDEFSELLSQHPDLAELFAAIGRVGRSLRMHLLLASQRLDEGRMRGLETHLSYRICLKTFSASESRAAIGVADAYELPTEPGVGFLRLGAGALVRFETAYVSGPHRQLSTPDALDPAEDIAPHLFTARWTPQPTTLPVGAGERPAPSDGLRQSTVLRTVVDRLSGHGAPAHRVWLPPLDSSPSLGSLLVPTPAAPGVLHHVCIGVVDSPFEQRRLPLVVDLAGSAGHVAVVGAPQSGKSTAVRTLVSALALIHHPGQVQFYCLDFGGGALAALRDLPHVGAVATRHASDLVRRTVAEIESVIRRRELVFAEHGIESMAEYRRRRATGDACSDGDPYGDVFLIVDGWAALRQHFDDLETVITGLAAQGLSHGVHVVVTAARWAELRPAFKDLIGTRIELRLGDPADSEMDRKRARLVADRPGRGVSSDGKLTAIALPHLDGPPDSDGAVLAGELSAGADVITTVRRRWGDGRAPQVRLLPVRVDRSDVPADSVIPHRLVLGLCEHELLPAALDFAEHPHLVILGDSGCGKTATLRALCREIVTAASADTAKLVIVDPRRTLLGVVDTEHLLTYAMSASAVTAQLPQLLDLLRARLPGAEVSQHQLRQRSWWEGPEIFVLVDDYDLIATPEGNPLAPIAEFLPHASDIGLHVVVARRSGGAGRAMYEPVLARLRECGAAGLMMSTSPDEGVLWNPVRPSPMPPGRAALVTRSGAGLVHVAWTQE